MKEEWHVTMGRSVKAPTDYPSTPDRNRLSHPGYTPIPPKGHIPGTLAFLHTEPRFHYRVTSTVGVSPPVPLGALVIMSMDAGPEIRWDNPGIGYSILSRIDMEFWPDTHDRLRQTYP